MIKRMPVFSNLEMEDQKALLKDTVRKALQLMLAYFSLLLDLSNDAIVWSNGANIYELFAAIGIYYKSDLIINAAYKIYINPMKAMNSVRPSTEEFALLLALLVLNLASPAGLSPNAKFLLNAEAEKYAKILMEFELNRLGQSRGPSRYMELQTLLWNAISSTHKAHKMYAYLDTVLEPGCVHRAFHPVLCQFMLKDANNLF